MSWNPNMFNRRGFPNPYLWGAAQVNSAQLPALPPEWSQLMALETGVRSIVNQRSHWSAGLGFQLSLNAGPVQERVVQGLHAPGGYTTTGPDRYQLAKPYLSDPKTSFHVWGNLPASDPRHQPAGSVWVHFATATVPGLLKQSSEELAEKILSRNPRGPSFADRVDSILDPFFRRR